MCHTLVDGSASNLRDFTLQRHSVRGVLTGRHARILFARPTPSLHRRPCGSGPRSHRMQREGDLSRHLHVRGFHGGMLGRTDVPGASPRCRRLRGAARTVRQRANAGRRGSSTRVRRRSLLRQSALHGRSTALHVRLIDDRRRSATLAMRHLKETIRTDGRLASSSPCRTRSQERGRTTRRTRSTNCLTRVPRLA